METPICPNCGCSLVRLGISKADAIAHTYEKKEYYFCCDACLEEFTSDPDKHLRETSVFVVCPVCLGEKPLDFARKLEFEGDDLYYCRCPHCRDAFNKNPEYYIRRLRGDEDQPGTFKAACCPD
jgi:YHS domain-containing protein